MRLYATRICPQPSKYFYFPSVRVLPELTLSFERNPHRDLWYCLKCALMVFLLGCAVVTGWSAEHPCSRRAVTSSFIAKANQGFMLFGISVQEFPVFEHIAVSSNPAKPNNFSTIVNFKSFLKADVRVWFQNRYSVSMATLTDWERRLTFHRGRGLIFINIEGRGIFFRLSNSQFKFPFNRERWGVAAIRQTYGAIHRDFSYSLGRNGNQYRHTDFFPVWQKPRALRFNYVTPLFPDDVQGTESYKYPDQSEQRESEIGNPSDYVVPSPRFRHGSKIGDIYGGVLVAAGTFLGFSLCGAAAFILTVQILSNGRAGWLGYSLAIFGAVVLFLIIGTGIIGCLPNNWHRCLCDGEDHSEYRQPFQHDGGNVPQSGLWNYIGESIGEPCLTTTR